MTDIKTSLRERARRERAQKFMSSNFNVILKAPEIVAAITIASYISYEFEPSTEEINQTFLRDGKTLLLPKINGENLDWIKWDGQSSSLRSNKKILEPVGEAVTDLSIIEAIVVPSLRIDQSGYRLGQGGGYYDRALVHINAWKVGLVHAGELTSEALPHETHDIALNAAATPSILVRFKSTKF
jgi:5-formyltetrahydrofolate cyclo-ligase